ncbi:MAG: glycosyltransferase [Planctomycetota bacterium]
MRVALLSHASDPSALGPDGLVDGLLDHARALVGLGHRVVVFASARDAALPADLDGVEIVDVAVPDRVLTRALTLGPAQPFAGLASHLAAAHAGLRALGRRLRAGEFDVAEIVGDAPAMALIALCDGVPALLRPIGLGAPQATAVERFAAGRLLRLGLRAARAVSVPSLWLRDRLHRLHLLERHALVVHDGVSLRESAPPSEQPTVRLWFDGGDASAREVALAFAPLSEHFPALRVQVDGPSSAASAIAILRDGLPAASASASEGATVALLCCGDVARVPSWLLRTMAAGVPVVAPARGAVPEAVRHELDGLLFDRTADLARPLERLLRTATLRERLAQAAQRRVATRFDVVEAARRRLLACQLAVEGRVSQATPVAASPAPVTRGSEDWFDAWWVAGTERVPTRLDHAALLALPHAELKLVEAVLVRSWCEGPADWSAPEWTDLREFSAAVLRRADELRRSGAAEPRATAAALVLPPITHPLFGAGEDGILLAELWRLEAHTGVAAWLSAAVARRDFVALATDNVNLRRIAVEAARRTPSVAAFEVLRRLYRDPKRREVVIAADVEFLGRTGADAFRRGIDDFGLHAPLARTKFPQPRRTKTGKTIATSSPRVTVVVPSFRHEAYIGAAIESCLRQSIDDLRVIVADDRSPDRTAEVAAAIDDPRVRVSVNEQNLGLGASVLGALQQVDTPYVALLNSDDLFHAQRLEKCLAVLDGDPQAALVATSFAVVDRSGNLLSHATACAAEIGPQAYGWLRWFEAIERDELLTPADWTSFEVLLRHNVLATSSNMVFRTDWLREHMPDASRLKYCLDWQLFLQAAMEGSLRVVPEKLLAYRLHDANTVWFREGGRADYVIEVNRVVDRVLVQWLERATARDGAAAAVEAFATILERAVELHGETDGLALYLAGLARRLGDDAIDVGLRPVAALADAALRRKIHNMVMRQVEVDPWSIPWRVRTAGLWRIEHEVAEGYTARTRDLERESGELRMEVDMRRRVADDERQQRERAFGEVERLRAELAHRGAELDELKRQREQAEVDFAKAREELTAHLDVAREQAERLRETVRVEREEHARTRARSVDLESRLAEARARVGVLDAEIEGLRTTIAEQDRDLEAARHESLTQRAELDAQRAAIDAQRVERQRLEEQLMVLEARLRDARAGLAELEARHTKARSALTAALETVDLDRRMLVRATARLAERPRSAEQVAADDDAALAAAWLDGLRLRGAIKTARGFVRRGVDTLRRARWALGRMLSAKARACTAVTIFDDGIPQCGGTARSVIEACALAAFGPRVVGFGLAAARAHRAEADRALRAAGLGPALEIVDDASLCRRDRSHFGRRVTAGLTLVEGLLGARHPSTGRALRAARLAKTRGTGLCIAHGLGEPALFAVAAHWLTGARFAVVLEGAVGTHPLPERVQEVILAEADLVVVDDDALRCDLEARVPRRKGRILLRPPAVPSPRPRDGLRRGLALLPGVHGRSDHETLVAALSSACANRRPELEIVPSPPSGQATLSELGLRARLEVAGLLSRVAAERDPEAWTSDLDTLVWIAKPGAAVPREVHLALARGRRVIATDLPATRSLPSGELLVLVRVGDRGSLQDALGAALSRPVDDDATTDARMKRFAAGREVLDGAFTSACQDLRGRPRVRR